MDTRSPPVVLIVDDDPDVADSVADALLNCGLSAVVMPDAPSLLQFARSAAERPCVVVTDLEMPLMNGVELIRTIREDETLRSIRIVVLSATPQAAPLSADAVLGKPFDLIELRETILQLLAIPD